MPNKTLLIDARPATTLSELLPLLAGGHLPTPRNLDAFADFVRETGVKAIVLRGCRLSISEYTSFANVCRDERVRLTTA